MHSKSSKETKNETIFFGISYNHMILSMYSIAKYFAIRVDIAGMKWVDLVN